MQRHLRLLILVLPVLLVLAIFAPTQSFFSHQYDDPYITYRYAINLGQGHGLVFNVGEHTDSASSFLYALMLTCAWLLHLTNLELVGGVIGVLSLATICLITYKLAKAISGDESASLIVAVACGLNGLMSGWTLSGMETLPWVALVLGAIYLMTTKPQSPFVILAIAAASFTRLEGIFLVVPFLVLAATDRRLAGGRVRRILSISGLVAVFVLFYVLKHAYYGVWISHAYQMKAIAVYYHRAPRQLIRLWALYVSVPALLCIPECFKRKNFFVLAYVSLSLVSVAFGPKSDWARYSVHLLPLLYAFSAPTLVYLWRAPRTAFRNAVVSIVLIALFAQVFAATRFNWINMTSLADDQACRDHLAAFLVQNVDKEQYIASSDLGSIAYHAMEFRFVDLIALTSADVLQAFEQGQNADQILINKHVHYMADTSNTSHSLDRLGTLLEEFPRVKANSSFTIDLPHTKFFCTAKDGTHFFLAPLEKKQSLPSPTSSSSDGSVHASTESNDTPKPPIHSHAIDGSHS